MKFNISSLSSFCLPSKIYFVLAVLSIIISLIVSTENFIMGFLHLLFVVFWTWVLNLICKNGFSIISWILVLVPILIYLIIVFQILLLIRKKNIYVNILIKKSKKKKKKL